MSLARWMLGCFLRALGGSSVVFGVVLFVGFAASGQVIPALIVQAVGGAAVLVLGLALLRPAVTYHSDRASDG